MKEIAIPPYRNDGRDRGVKPPGQDARTGFFRTTYRSFHRQDRGYDQFWDDLHENDPEDQFSGFS
ncbi:hypothetical protein [Methanofollis ethanolicus]|uniref:hypothetical protein n=1 Tax=Methanofollis ethanolicus TaxID=488124 RepID=UPI00128F8E3C|nr:hypothetical protein [Methanofollis ethanolicus]